MRYSLCEPFSFLILLAASTLACPNFGCSSESSRGTSSGASGETTSSSSVSSGGNADGCVKAGGVCGCAGGCNIGYHLADPPLLDQCPQPCDQCGACSQQCCFPDTDAGGGAGGSGGTGAGGAGGTGAGGAGGSP